MLWSWTSALKITLFLLLVSAVIVAILILPIQQILNDFLIWVDRDLGKWGPLALAVAYIPLTILAVPASVLTLGGGYLFGLPIGIIADSIGATIGVVAAFLLGGTVCFALIYSWELKKFKTAPIVSKTPRHVNTPNVININIRH
ncbi:unnamed protein product [Lathyrus sativus]|nr:unnamed protein product [Lathyrus sativus]